MKKEKRNDPVENEVEISQEVVDQLLQARTMDEYLSIAAENGIDWDSLDDEWLEAIVSGDVGDLLWRQQRRHRRTGRVKNENRL